MKIRSLLSGPYAIYLGLVGVLLILIFLIIHSYLLRDIGAAYKRFGRKNPHYSEMSTRQLFHKLYDPHISSMERAFARKEMQARGPEGEAISREFLSSIARGKRSLIADLCFFAAQWPDSTAYLVNPLLQLLKTNIPVTDAASRLPIFDLFIFYLNDPEVESAHKQTILDNLHMRVYHVETMQLFMEPVKEMYSLQTGTEYRPRKALEVTKNTKSFARLLYERHPFRLDPPEDDQALAKIVRRHWIETQKLAPGMEANPD